MATGSPLFFVRVINGLLTLSVIRSRRSNSLWKVRGFSGRRRRMPSGNGSFTQ